MRKILVVESDAASMEAACRILRDEGYQVDESLSLEEARKKLLQTDYSVVVTDISLPDSSGSKVVRTLKKIRTMSEIVVTAREGTLDLAVECMRSGAVDYLLKPCQHRPLAEAVQKAVEKRELSRENLQLRALNEMKDKFLTLVSHELRTPLTLIYGYLTILQRQSFDFSKDQTDLLNIIMKSSQQLIGIVNNIQTIAQADSGEMKLHLQLVAPRRIMADVLSEMQATLSERNLSLQLEDGEELQPIAGDAIRLHQIIAELVQNSVRNTKDGGVIVLAAKEAGSFIVLSVKDNGIGIPEEEQGKVFESFYEVADVKKHTSSVSRFGGGGIGIGLSLVKRVVEAHNGSIHLESSPGNGTCVEIWLPKKFQPFGTDFQNRFETG